MYVINAISDLGCGCDLHFSSKSEWEFYCCANKCSVQPGCLL